MNTLTLIKFFFVARFDAGAASIVLDQSSTNELSYFLAANFKPYHQLRSSSLFRLHTFCTCIHGSRGSEVPVSYCKLSRETSLPYE